MTVPAPTEPVTYAGAPAYRRTEEGPMVIGRHEAHEGCEAHEGGEQREARRLGAAELGAGLGERATLVQFSSAFCQPCRATRRTLAEVAGMVDGVAHVEIDAEGSLGLVRELDVLRTPTVLVLDSCGRIVRRASGLPRRADVIAALGAAVRSGEETR